MVRWTFGGKGKETAAREITVMALCIEIKPACIFEVVRDLVYETTSKGTSLQDVRTGKQLLTVEGTPKNIRFFKLYEHYFLTTPDSVYTYNGSDISEVAKGKYGSLASLQPGLGTINGNPCEWRLNEEEGKLELITNLLNFSEQAKETWLSQI